MSPQSHWVMTMLRSMPFGRGGASGTWPAAMRPPQSASASSRASRPRPIAVPSMLPAFLRPASSPARLPRMPRALAEPIWWQSLQPSLKSLIQACWLRPPGSACVFAGGLKSDSQ